MKGERSASSTVTPEAPDRASEGGDSGDTGACVEGRVIECGLCGVAFEEDRGQPTCQSCPLARACRFVRCPHCGYENPVTPGWLSRLQELVERRG